MDNSALSTSLLLSHDHHQAINVDDRVVEEVDKFLNGVQFIKQHLKRVEKLYSHLQKSYQESNNIHYSKDIHQLITSQMRYDVTAGVDMSKSILLQLETLSSTSSDDPHSLVVNQLREEFNGIMGKFSNFRETIASGSTDHHLNLMIGVAAEENTSSSYLDRNKHDEIMKAIKGVEMNVQQGLRRTISFIFFIFCITAISRISHSVVDHYY